MKYISVCVIVTVRTRICVFVCFENNFSRKNVFCFFEVISCTVLFITTFKVRENRRDFLEKLSGYSLVAN